MGLAGGPESPKTPGEAGSRAAAAFGKNRGEVGKGTAFHGGGATAGDCKARRAAEWLLGGPWVPAEAEDHGRSGPVRRRREGGAYC